MASTQMKLKQLKSNLHQMGSILVAFSGGVDSTFLLATARDVLGPAVIAITERSEVFPARELQNAKKIARSLRVEHLIINNNGLDNEKFCANPVDRCYWCKKDLYTKVEKISVARGGFRIVDGTNYDDLTDFRPGILAANEKGVEHPLADAELTKEEIRQLSKERGLLTWNKEPMACLASRIPYGTKITPQRLRMIEEGEDFLRDLGLKEVRLRLHDDKTARIEVSKDSMPQLLKHSAQVVKELKSWGLTYITFDLEGYRSGSMNNVRKRD
jgi:uncharacterized protein